MQRREFLKHACGAGLCGCAIAALFTPHSALATDESKPTPKPEAATPPEDPRSRFAQERYAKLLNALSTRVDAAALSGALAEVGGYCASEFKPVTTFAGKPDEFLKFIREKWHGDAEYDAAHGLVTIAFPPMPECPCALARKGVTPGTMCECSLGWQKHVFGIVFGRPVDVKLKGSLLRGAQRCSFEVRLV